MTLILAGVLILVLYFCNDYVLGRPPMTTRGATSLPLARRLNNGLAIFGVAAILLGLLYYLDLYQW
jgi:hypothetical protein